MRARRAFTLVELLVVIGIIALLISILLPALNKAKTHAMKIQCGSNIRQVAMAVLAYANDWNGTLPYNYCPATEMSAIWHGRLTGDFFIAQDPKNGGQWTSYKGEVVYLAEGSDAWLCPFVVSANIFAPMYFNNTSELRRCYGMNFKLRPWMVFNPTPPTKPVYPIKLATVKSKIPLLADGHPYLAGGRWLWTDWNTDVFDDTWYRARGPWNARAPWPINRPNTDLPSNSTPGPEIGVVTKLHGGCFSAAYPDGHVEQLKKTTAEMFQYP